MNKIREEKWDIMRGTTQFQWIIMEYFENLYDHKLVNTENIYGNTCLSKLNQRIYKVLARNYYYQRNWSNNKECTNKERLKTKLDTYWPVPKL